MLSSGSVTLFAQYKSEKEATIPLEHFYIERQKGGLRHLLTKLHWSISTGYGHSTLKHDLAGFGILQQKDSIPLVFKHDAPTVRYSNWFNTVTPHTYSTTASPFLVNSDTTKLGFKGKSFGIPIKASVHLEFDRYRIGGGYSYEYTHIGSFSPISYKESIGSFRPDVSNFFMKKYFATVGAMVYRYEEYTLVADLNIGGYKLGSSFDQSLIKRGMYYNLGATVEREMSEYLRFFVRPSYDIKTYKLSMPEGGQTINHHFNTFYVNIGLTYRLPELRRCFLKECHAQINHAHGNREYRSRRHPFYKKQNPHYGENYPTLIKYKGKNKNKLNPY
jgi:hypothetical protein